LQVVADVKHIPRQISGRVGQPRSSTPCSFSAVISAVCDVGRADPNFEQLRQSTVIAFMDAITLTA
jgi:hypothetical protein